MDKQSPERSGSDLSREQSVLDLHRSATLGHATMQLLLIMQEGNHDKYQEFTRMANPEEELTREQQADPDKQVLKRVFREEPQLFGKIMDQVPEAILYLDIEEDLGLPPGFELGEDLPPLF